MEAFKVVKVDKIGRRVSATYGSLPKDYAQVYVEADGAINVVSTSLVFDELEHALQWTKDTKGLEVWSCDCRTTENPVVLFAFSGMNEITANDRAPYDPEEMAALISGRAVRIWPEVRCEMRGGRPFLWTERYRPYNVLMAVPDGTLISRDVRLVEKLKET